MLLKIKNEDETERFGRALADQLMPGDIVCLVGDLGTGKTALTKAVAAGLGIEEHIVSPTFNIVKEYRSGRLPASRLSAKECFSHISEKPFPSPSAQHRATCA